MHFALRLSVLLVGMLPGVSSSFVAQLVPVAEPLSCEAVEAATMMSREGGLHDSDSLPVRISEVHEQIAKLLAVHATAGRNAPPIDVAWGWHVHRLSPRACMQGSRMLFGGIVTPA